MNIEEQAMLLKVNSNFVFLRVIVLLNVVGFGKKKPD
jgi:hypothetical protein